MNKYIYTTLLFLLLVSTIQAQSARKIQVLSAIIKDKRIEGAEVLLQKNGERTVVGHTNSNGEVILNPNFADDNEAIIIIKKQGYSTLVAKCPCAGLTYAISPVMTDLDGVRIVLSWGERPYDLDSHLWFSNDHIYWRDKVGSKANLDVDDTDSYGPETITIQERKTGVEYFYGVHNFSDKMQLGTRILSNSDAKVFVYIGESLVKTYYVPKSKIGNLWTVFKITKEGEIEDINSITDKETSESAKLRYSIVDAAGSINDVDKTEALRLNRLGTQQYDKKEYSEAIRYYMQAIELYPDFGQAYGNLGLSYKKNNQNAEALWANRKAIALASGKTEKVTKAGAYYNIGRIYEEKAEYTKAKEQYENAKAMVDRAAYDEAISRMDSFLNE